MSSIPIAKASLDMAFSTLSLDDHHDFQDFLAENEKYLDYFHKHPFPDLAIFAAKHDDFLRHVHDFESQKKELAEVLRIESLKAMFSELRCSIDQPPAHELPSTISLWKKNQLQLLWSQNCLPEDCFEKDPEGTLFALRTYELLLQEHPPLSSLPFKVHVDGTILFSVKDTPLWLPLPEFQKFLHLEKTLHMLKEQMCARQDSFFDPFFVLGKKEDEEIVLFRREIREFEQALLHADFLREKREEMRASLQEIVALGARLAMIPPSYKRPDSLLSIGHSVVYHVAGLRTHLIWLLCQVRSQKKADFPRDRDRIERMESFCKENLQLLARKMPKDGLDSADLDWANELFHVAQAAKTQLYIAMACSLREKSRGEADFSSMDAFQKNDQEMSAQLNLEFLHGEWEKRVTLVYPFPDITCQGMSSTKILQIASGRLQVYARACGWRDSLLEKVPQRFQESLESILSHLRTDEERLYLLKTQGERLVQGCLMEEKKAEAADEMQVDYIVSEDLRRQRRCRDRSWIGFQIVEAYEKLIQQNWFRRAELLMRMYDGIEKSIPHFRRDHPESIAEGWDNLYLLKTNFEFLLREISSFPRKVALPPLICEAIMRSNKIGRLENSLCRTEA
jgi:hypothetical protein